MRLIIFATLLSSAFARPQPVSEDAVIVSYESESDPSGAYRFSYQTSDSQAREEQGFIKNAGTDNEALSVTGSYSYFGTDGLYYKVTYTADENGYQPKKGYSAPLANEFLVPDKKFTSFLDRIASERSRFHENGHTK